ncbi:segregation/condensation protein A [Streptomyces sp. NPDC094034]|uniref:segregation and condensation protein A n=1 Tax=Streptomyces sp. NPDC094034 TaxID=3155309 RepID=UPI0033267BA5
MPPPPGLHRQPRRTLGRGPGASPPEPVSEPVSEPAPVPEAPPVPVPEPVAEPASVPEPEPEPAPVLEPVPEPAPVLEPAAEHEHESAPGDGRFTVRLVNFEGPFDLLLQLISKHKLDVTEVALSKVTDEFMAHIRAMGPDWDLDQTTEFLVVAATLLDLKAARLLPAAEIEDEADLALLEARDLLFARLLQYRAYKQVAEIFSERLDAEGRRYPRTVGLEPHHAALLPEVVISIGPEGFARLAVKAMQPKPRPQVYVEHIHAPLVSVREQAGIVVALLRERGEAGFSALIEDAGDTLTVVARFLALLELYRERAVALDQEEALGPLMVRWTGGDGDVEAAVTDEFDRESGADGGAAEAAAGGEGRGTVGGTGRGTGEGTGEKVTV